jgi:two-component system response regulator YesN
MRQMELFGIALGQHQFIVASIEIDDMYSLWNDAGEISLWKFAVSNILNDIFGYEAGHIVFNGPEGRIISIVGLEKQNDRNGNYIEKYRRACELVERYLKFTITIGVGNPVDNFKAIRNSYLESLAALQNKVAVFDNKVIQASSISSESMSIGSYPNEVNEKLIIALRTNDNEEAVMLLNDVFNYIKEKRLSFEYVYIVVMGLVSLCLSFINETGKNVDLVFGKDFSPYTEIKSKASLDALQQWLVKLFETALKYSDEGKNTKSKKIVDSVREYISENYHDSNLSVEGIANGIYINSSYLRKIFKKELNMSVNDYIVDLRMQKAKELIGSGNIRLSDISEMVGYNDAGYFSKSFKKKYGFSPSGYENLKK